MSFHIRALPMEPFTPLFELTDQELRERRALRRTVDRSPGFPCRVSLQDAQVGETVILLHYEHQPADSPYRASHAIFVREHARQAHCVAGEVPEQLRSRVLSVRAFDDDGMLQDAALCDGAAVEPVIARMFADARIDYLHLHYAKHGCYAARVERA